MTEAKVMINVDLPKLREEFGDSIQDYMDNEATINGADKTYLQIVHNELRLIQEIHRRMWLLRSALGVGLYACECGSFEGEFHTGECICTAANGETFICAAPAGWEPGTPPPSVQVELKDWVDKPCQMAPAGCIYSAMPDTKYCFQHRHLNEN